MKTNIVHVVTSLPRPVVGVAWQNRYEATTASILALRMAAAVLPNVRGKTGEHALQLQMPLASVPLLLPTAATTPVITVKPVPPVPEIAELVVAAVEAALPADAGVFVAAVAEFLYKITEPVLRPIRSLLPNLGGIDISPVILILLLFFVQNLLTYDVPIWLGLR